MYFCIFCRIFKLTSPAVQASEHLLHASVLSMVEFDDDIFAAGNCFDWNQHPLKKGLFCLRFMWLQLNKFLYFLYFS